MARSVVGVIAVMMLVGCGDGGPAGDDDDDDDDDVTQPDAAAPRADAGPTEELSVQIGPVVVEPGAEDTICVVVPLPNENPATIRAIRTELSAGTHHVIVNRDTSGAAQPEPVSCGAFAGADGDNDLLFIAQQPQAEIRYPYGAGLRVDAQQLIHLEMHYFNYLPDSEQAITATVTFELADVDAGELRPVDIAFTGDLALTIPPMSSETVTSFHILPEGVELFAVTSHTHQRGTYASIHRATSVDDPGTLLHESTNWAEPPLDTFDPIVLAPGEGLKLTCEYFNPTSETIAFGLGFEDEMCFLWAHYVEPAP